MGFWSSSWAVLPITFAVLALLGLGAKGLPLSHSIRLLPSLYRLFGPRIVSSLRNTKSHEYHHPFVVLTSSSRATLTDLDINLHKSNSTFFTDADISRATLLSRLLGTALAGSGGGGDPSTKSSGALFILAAVQCTFRREIRPFQKYKLATQILTWDGKHLFVATFFLRPGSDVPSWEGDAVKSEKGTVFGKDVFAVLVAKYVFKAGRVTVEPRQVLESAGLLSNDETTKESDTQGAIDQDALEKRRKWGLEYVRTCMV